MLIMSLTKINRISFARKVNLDIKTVALSMNNNKIPLYSIKIVA